MCIAADAPDSDRTEAAFEFKAAPEMKFGSEWKMRIASLDDSPLREHMLDYKRWKKMSKGVLTQATCLDEREAIGLLEKQLAVIDLVYLKSFRYLMTSSKRVNKKKITSGFGGFRESRGGRAGIAARVGTGSGSMLTTIATRVGACIPLLPYSSSGKRFEPLLLRSWATLYEFVAFSRKTVYKVSKRLDKAFRKKLLLSSEAGPKGVAGAHSSYASDASNAAAPSSSDTEARTAAVNHGGWGAMMSWFKLVAPTRFAFLANDGRWKLLRIRADVQEAKDVCPICLEEDYERCIITRCGHAICLQCVEGMIRKKHPNGTLTNLLRAFEHETDMKCPVCRGKQPFRACVECDCVDR